MAINLTNPMTGDAFKAEVEKALDRTTGGVINGKIYKENEEQSSEYITRKYIDDFVYYLNNVSPITLRRNSNGDVVLSEYIDVDANSFTFANRDMTGGKTYSWTNVYSFNINRYSLGYKSPYRTIRVNLSHYCSKEIKYGGSQVLIYYSFYLKDESGNVVYSNIEKGRPMKEGDLNFSYDIDTSILKEDVIYSIDITIRTTKNNFDDTITYKLSFQSLQEQVALRDIIEY